MSQSSLLDASRDDEWDEWYLGHLRAMVTAPGVFSAQRFRTDTPGFPRSLAAYSIGSPAVFNDPVYLQVRGFREWQPLIDRRHYHRNLFEGLDQMPAVAAYERLLVCDRELAEGSAGGVELVWLTCVGIDHSTPHRGIAVVPAKSSHRLEADAAVYRPVSERVAGSR